MEPKFKEIIDLAVPMKSLDTVVLPGYPQPHRTKMSTIKENGYNNGFWSFGEHTATHVDAPIHMLEGGLTVEKIPLKNYIGPGVALDFSDKKPQYHITKADIQQALKASGRDGDVGNGWVVLFYMGYTAKGRTPDWMKNPELSKEASEYLVGLGVIAVGMDAAGPDSPPFEAHKTLLGNGVVIFENLTNVEKVLGKEFLFVGTPIAFVGGTAGVTRPVALVM